ncbi:MAG: hypothetical protein Q9227_009361 [Pyrenula ochraceoflavens]
MPQYFFHVQIELFTPPRSPTNSSQSQAWPEGIQSLAPLLKKKPLNRTFPGQSEETQGELTAGKLSSNFDGEKRAASSFARYIPNEATHSHDIETRDQRLDWISIHETDMNDIKPGNSKRNEDESHINKGIGTSTSGLQTKGRYISLDKDAATSAWGIVHLYRDAEETSGLEKEYSSLRELISQQQQRAGNRKNAHSLQTPKDEECTTLCILAVPSYMGPSDFLGWVGEESRNQISHFRMIRTARANRYMVLMKFRNGREARHWQHEWNGRVFNSMEPETCHVVFCKSVELTTPSSPNANADTFAATFPDPRSDPFTSRSSNKPFAPPTRSLIELPTCPVCLERMDETSGLLTILCQHVFHCTCLQKWSGGGCPVCRYTHDDFSSHPSTSKSKSKSKPKSKFFDDDDGYDSEPLECHKCHSETNLWQCLICGAIGCGRYDAAHAFAHFKDTGHTFAMDLESKRVWDYTGDAYVHRIIADAPQGNTKEPPTTTGGLESEITNTVDWADGGAEDALGLEYTHLLTSQLESQRVYFEEKVERAADKASQAVEESAKATKAAEAATKELRELRDRYEVLVKETVPSLEKENRRLEKRAGRFEEMSRAMERQWREEKSLAEGLKVRLDKVGEEVAGLREEKENAERSRREAEEMARDLQFFISGQEKIREMEKQTAEGNGDGVEVDEIREGTVSLPEAAQTSAGGGRKGKRKGKGRK